MAEAEVGDDFLGEDPTAARLVERVREIFGAEDAVYVPSGRMANLSALWALTEQGDEVICHEHAHFFNYEAAALSAVCGAQARPLPGRRGVLDAGDIERAIRPRADYLPRSRVIAVENTHNQEGGAVYPIDDLRAARKIADEYGLSLYMDGARVFNAALAAGVRVADYCRLVDGMMFSFSKGLGAPIGSMVVGPADFIARVHRARKTLGGGMRQVGVIAAACLVALDTMIDRLAEDHANARRLAEGIAELRPEAVDLAGVETNIVMVRTTPFGLTPAQLTEEMAARGVKFFPFGHETVRMVTQKDVSADDVAYALEQLREVLT